MPDADRTLAAWRLAAGLARSRTESEAASWVARAAGHLAGAENVRVWMIDHTRGYRFSGAWPEEAHPPESPPPEVPRAVAFGAPGAAAAKAPFRSRLVVPLLRGPRPLGAIELLEKRRADGAFTTGDADALGVLNEAADAALQAVREAPAREHAHAGTITRLVRLFDVGRTLTTTLDMEVLAEAVADRTRASLEADNAYLWLIDETGEHLTVSAASGPAADAVRGWDLPIGEGLAGQVAADGEAVRHADAEEIPGVEDRPDLAAGVEILSAAAAPILTDEGHVIGVLEVVNREDEEAFEDDDVALLRELAETTAAAIGNARRFDAERRASDLGSLLATAQQLGASLEARKIALTLVHQAASVIKYRRAAVGLLKGGRLDLAAVSGQSFVDEKLPEMKALKEILAWASGLDEGIYVVQEADGTIDTARPETREKFRAYFEQSGSRSFLAVPLKDDEGRVGVFAIEADDPYAFEERDLEAAGLLAALTTVAVRNAILFEQIPMVRMFRPFAKSTRKFMSLPWRRRAAWAAGIAIGAAIFLLVPVPLRIGGEARVLPQIRRPVAAEVEGRVARVLVREGDAVEAGQILALLDETEYRMGEEDARARYEVAIREQSRLRADGRTADAAVESARVDGLRAELDLWEQRIDRTRIRSRAPGIVATPRVEELVGSRLDRGAIFCEVVEPGKQRIEVAVAESDAGLLAPGMPIKVKLSAYPTDSLRAQLERVGVAATIVRDERVFLVQARLLEAGPPLRPGMTGRAKINTGPASLARVLLRAPARSIWSWVWGWLP